LLIEYHRNLLSDKVRNEAFERALRKVVKKGETVVADIGSGTGLMGFLASRLGAKEVYCYEFGGIIDLSKKLAKANKIKNIHFIHNHSTDVEKPVPVDVIVSETLGNFGLEEHIIASLEDAKRFLRPGGAIIPGRIEHFACPVLTDRFFRELSVWDRVGFGLDYDAAKTMSLNNIYVRTFAPKDLLDDGKAALGWDVVDFNEKNRSSRSGEVSWTLKESADIYGIAIWWNCELVPSIELSTSPLAPKTHWEQLYFPVLEPVHAKKGDKLTVAITSRSSFEEGTTIKWVVTHEPVGGKTKRQSMDLTEGWAG
jgi:SAM-dependent methyltransferase